MLCVCLCVVLMGVGRPWLALLTLIFSVGCAAAVSWIQISQIKPTPRRDIVKRGGQKTDFGRGLLAVCLLLLGGSGLGCAATGYRVMAIVLLSLTVAAVLLCFRGVALEEVHTREFARSDGAGGGT
jgi:hypothetical protein